MRIVVSFFFTFLPILLLSQKIDTLPEVSVTAHRLQQFQNGQYQVALDSLATLRNRSLNELLAFYTPITLKNYGTGLTTLSLRGTGSNHTAILWNGFDIRHPMLGDMDLSLLFNQRNTKIGLKTGNNTALAGAGAIGGVLYLESDFQARGHEISTQIGSYGEWNNQVSLNFKRKKQQVNLNLLYQKAKNDFEFRNTAEIGQPLQRQQNAAFWKSSSVLDYQYDIKTNEKIRASVWYNKAQRQIAPPMASTNDNAQQNDWSLRATAEYQRKTFKIKTAFFLDDLFFLSNAVDSSKNRTQTINTEIEKTYLLPHRQQLQIGANYQHAEAQTTNYNTRPQRERVALFAAYQTSLKNKKWVLGANLRQELIDNRFAPIVFAINGKYQMSKNIFLRSNISRHYNLPTFNDLYWRDLGNRNLRPENGYAAEIGGDYQLSKNQTLQTTFYYLNISDWIQWYPLNGTQYRPSNLKRVLSKGIEMDYQGKTEHWTWNLGYRLTISENREIYTNKAPQVIGKQLIYVPIHGANVALEYRYKNWNIVYEQRLVGKRFASEDNSSTLKPFSISNVGLGYEWKKVAINAKINNIFNNDYQVINYYAMPRSTYLLTFSMAF